MTLIKYIDVLVMNGQHDEQMASRTKTLTKYMSSRVWEINPIDINDLPLQ